MTKKRPIIMYVDDEPHNLTVFEATIGMNEEWDIITFSDPVKALSELKVTAPSVIVSDQRMPHMTGVDFLELAKQLHPDSVRIVVTGYSDEDLIVEAVRKAGIYDYIKKPWEADDLIASLKRAVEFHQAETNMRFLLKELQKSQAELQKTNDELKNASVQLELAALKEKEMRKELECWVPPAILHTLQNKSKFPISTDLVGLSFDIIGSSKIHDLKFNGKLVRSHIIQTFTECVLKHRGWRESHSGDSAYAHFGAIEKIENPADAALAAAREFRVALRGLSQSCGQNVEVGISLHICTDVVVDIHEAQLMTSQGPIIQKSFDTSAPGIDMLHRIEKLVHKLPGTNIIMSKVFKDKLSKLVGPLKVINAGKHKIGGSSEVYELFIMPSDLIKSEEEVERIIATEAS